MASFWPNFFLRFYGPRKQAFPSGYDGPIVHSCSQSKPDSEFALPDRCLSETSWSCQRLPFFAKTPNKPKNHCKSCIGQPHQDGNAKRFASAPTKFFYGKYVCRVCLQRSICCRIPAQFQNMVALYIPSSRIRIKQHPWIMSPQGCLFFF